MCKFFVEGGTGEKGKVWIRGTTHNSRETVASEIISNSGLLWKLRYVIYEFG